MPVSRMSAAWLVKQLSANSSSDELTVRPSPSAVRASSAARMAVAALIPDPMSRTGAPTLTGPPASLPVTAMMPPAAWRIRSKPPRAASGPVWPNPEIDAYTSRGLSACRWPGPRPARSSDPGRAFSTNTSLARASVRTSPVPPGAVRSIAMLRLPVFSEANRPLRLPTVTAPWARYGSPPGSPSTLITSAPSASSTIVQ